MAKTIATAKEAKRTKKDEKPVAPKETISKKRRAEITVDVKPQTLKKQKLTDKAKPVKSAPVEHVKEGKKSVKATKKSKEPLSEPESDVEELEIVSQSTESEGEGEVEGDDFATEKSEIALSKDVEDALKEKIHQISKPSAKSGVVYLGRIPHGFYEEQMKEYFTQFGQVNQLRLSRNRKTGKSKHYGFIEFKSAEVAQIVAETMDNYLMFGHILKCILPFN
jgi:nucleolar protein 15